MGSRIGTCLALMLALQAPAAASDEVTLTALDDSGYSAASEGVVQLLCRNAEGRYFLSRAIVLDLDHAGIDHDVILTARHAVHDRHGERDCTVRGSEPEAGDIDSVRTSPREAQSSGDFDRDWAVLRTAGRLPDAFPRVRAAVYSGLETGEVSMIVRAVRYEPCDITPAPKQMENPMLIFHSCPSRPGLSGSPMMTMIDGESFLVGVHLGEFVMLNEDSRRYSVARRISDDFLDAVIDVVTDRTSE